MLGAAIGITTAAALCLGFALWDLSQRRSAAPAVVAVEKTVLAEALEDAPWISSGGDGPELWLVTATDCPACRTFEQRVLPGLLDRGIDAHVILVVPEAANANDEQAQKVAALAKRRDWVSLHNWMNNRDDIEATLEPAAAEGFVEWGRASYERIGQALRRNGQELAAPALFWRSGPEWRASVRPDSRATAFLENDLGRAD